MFFTVDISSMVIDSIQTGPISGVPNSDCIIPGTFTSQIQYYYKQRTWTCPPTGQGHSDTWEFFLTWNKKVRNLRVPQQASDWSFVATQHIDACVLCVVPDSNSAGKTHDRETQRDSNCFKHAQIRSRNSWMGGWLNLRWVQENQLLESLFQLLSLVCL